MFHTHIGGFLVISERTDPVISWENETRLCNLPMSVVISGG